MELIALQQRRATAFAALEAALAISDPQERDREFAAKEAEVTALDSQIAQSERVSKLKGERAMPGPGIEGISAHPGFFAKYASFPKAYHDPRPGHTLSAAQEMALGDMLTAVIRADMGRGQDERLFQAATGASEGIPSDGGWLVEKDLADGLVTRSFQYARIADRARRIPISAGSNGIKINALKDNSRAAGSRWGGIRGYWVPEGGTITASRPQFRQMRLELRKLAGLFYATDELLQDAAAMAAIVSEAFPQEFGFLLDKAMFEGVGSGEPLGFMNAGCKISVSKETGQPAATIVYENIVNMWSRLPPGASEMAEWWVNQECLPQLMLMSQVIGTGGVPVFLPPGGASTRPLASLFGRPVRPIEHCNALGTEGDIVLADPTSYLMIDKGGIQSASSIHVQFLTHETAFRFTYRVDGQPVDDLPITPAKGSATQSNFITLATRA